MGDDKKLSGIALGFRKRTLVTARLGAKLGLSALKKQLGAEDAAPSAEDAVAAATALVEQLGSLKGLVMKVGQMASYLHGSLPPAAQEVMSRLQAQSQPLAFARIDETLRAELGAPARELFESFDETPFAAASIGQVHRATFQGRPVAVKVQYPGIEDVIRSDLRTVGALLRLSLLPTAADGAGLAEELRDRMIEECDYRAEARNQLLFAKLLGALPDSRVPAPILERSARRVLTSELVDGLPFGRFAREAPQERKDRAGAAIFAACFSSIFHHCVYNADPHPGNYLFGDDGAVWFLDFGCIRRFDPAMIARWKKVALATTRGDKKAFIELYPTLGLAPRPDKLDWDYQWQIMQYVYLPFTSARFTYDEEYVKKSYQLLLWKNPNRNRQGMPREWLFLNRLQWGLNSVLAHLHATADWPGMWRAALESPTEPA